MNISQYHGESSSPGSHHILLVEDEPNVAKGLELVLSDEGYGVEIAETGRSALEKFHGNGFDLVVSDLRLPDIDGLEVIKDIRHERPEVKAIVITGYPSVSSAVDAVRLGVMDYLRKPFSDEDLVNAVKKAFPEGDRISMEQILKESEKKVLIQRQEVIRAIETAVRDSKFAARMDKDTHDRRAHRRPLLAERAHRRRFGRVGHRGRQP
ncbi:MAG: response regulator [Acidobacteria bacterium]|nr:response regulator [Acidobacteriota bacterium]